MEFLHDFFITFSITLLIFLLLSMLFSADDRRRVASEIVRSTAKSEEVENSGEMSVELDRNKEIEIESCVREGYDEVEISRSSEWREDNRSEEAQVDDADPSKGGDLVESVHNEDSSKGRVDVVFDDEVNELQAVDSSETELDKGKEQNIHDINKVQLKVDSSVDALLLLRDYDIKVFEGVDNRDSVLENELKEENIYEINEFQLKVEPPVESLREVDVVGEAILIMAQENSKESIASLSNFEHLPEMQACDDNLVEEDRSCEVLEEVHSRLLMVERVKEESSSDEEKSCVHEVRREEDSSTAVVAEPELLEIDNYLLKEEGNFQENETKIVEEVKIERDICNSLTENEFPVEDVTEEKNGAVGPLVQESLESEIGREEKSCVRCGGGETLLDDEDEWEGIERSEIVKLFGIANAYVGSAIGIDALSKLSTDVQMQLYALHKVATEGPCYESQPISFKVSARAKWHSWQSLGKMDPEVAMEQYMTILSQNIPGWMGDKSGESIKPLERDSASSNELSSGTERISQVRLRFPLTSTSSILWISFIWFAGSCFN